MLSRRLKGAPPPDRPVNVGLPRAVADDVDRFIVEYPEYGFRSRNEFATRATTDKLQALRRDVHERLLMEAHKAGKPGPLDELRRTKP